MTNSYDPEQIFHELERAAEKRAKAEYTAHRLELLGGHLLGQIMREKREDGIPVGLCKDLARSDERWLVHIEGEAAAIEERALCRAKYDNLRVLAEARRTQEASMRALAR